MRGFEGDLSASAGDRTVFATDNSIYQVMPQAVAFPRNATDVVRIAKLANEPRFAGITLTPRGGGTGTNGQSLTDGIVVDLSRHMNRILSVNAEERWAWVEAGVVKDQLNDAIREHGLFFAPELSPSNRATIGGMIATDASGQGSVLYGKTHDHVLELKCVLLDGTRLAFRALVGERARDGQAPHRPRRRCSPACSIASASTMPQLIAERFPASQSLRHRIRPRPSQRRRKAGFNLNSVLCGAEGTLAFVTEAKVNLVPIPHCSAIVNIRYESFDAALRDAGALMRMEAASSETIDATVLAAGAR